MHILSFILMYSILLYLLESFTILTKDQETEGIEENLHCVWGPPPLQHFERRNYDICWIRRPPTK